MKVLSSKRATIAACIGGAFPAVMGLLLYFEGKAAGKAELVRESQERFMQAVQADQPVDVGPVDPSPPESPEEVATDLPGDPPTEVPGDEVPTPTADPTPSVEPGAS